MKKHAHKLFITAILIVLLVPSVVVDAQSVSLIFYDDFSSDKGWIDESGGYIYRDTDNQWLVWQVRRSEQRRYYIPIDAISSSIQLNFRFNVKAAGGNGDVYVGFVESLDAPGYWPLDATGVFVGLWRDGAYGTKAGLIMRYENGDNQLITPSVSTINYGGLNVWRQASLIVDQGTWTLTVSTDDGIELGQMSGTLTGTHSEYRYLMVFRDNIGGWEWENGLLDDIQVYGIPINTPPILTVDQSNLSVDEGQSATNTGTINDPDGDTVNLTASVGTVTDSDDGIWSWSYTTADGPDQSQTVTISGDDGKGGTAEAPFELTVNNVPPTVETLATPDDPIQLGAAIKASATFSDPAGTNDEPYTCTVDYGDGEGARPGTVSGTTCTGPDQIYADPGVYQVTVTVSDKDGGTGSATATNFIVIYDPSAGFVTGGGWVDSPEGAFIADPSLVGKANFGFVSKYKKGATVPTGVTEFQFKVADLNFHSESYDWLVVAGAKAKFKGIGTINGDGVYKFLLTGIDADINNKDSFIIDRFRIKIWIEDADENETVIYDNGANAAIDDDNATTEIGGGSIVIHNK